MKETTTTTTCDETNEEIETAAGYIHVSVYTPEGNTEYDFANMAALRAWAEKQED